jgi:hypothetical protein
MMMKSCKFLAVALMLAAGTLAFAAPAAQSANHAAAAFARLKSLAGEWQTQPGPMQARATYRVIANGSAVLEHLYSPKEEMVTLYTLDGDRLLLTHYCGSGNQPRMVAERFNPPTGELDFAFLDITGLAHPGAAHMDNAKFQFLDQDHFNAQWQMIENGKPKMTAKLQYRRVN